MRKFQQLPDQYSKHFFCGKGMMDMLEDSEDDVGTSMDMM